MSLSLPWHHSSNMALRYSCITLNALTSSESVDVCTFQLLPFSSFFLFLLPDSIDIAYFLALYEAPAVLLLFASSRSLGIDVW